MALRYLFLASPYARRLANGDCCGINRFDHLHRSALPSIGSLPTENAPATNPTPVLTAVCSPCLYAFEKAPAFPCLPPTPTLTFSSPAVPVPSELTAVRLQHLPSAKSPVERKLERFSAMYLLQSCTCASV